MANTDHRVGVTEINLVRRTLKLDPQTTENVGELILEIDVLFGVDRVSYDEEQNVLSIDYDASRVNLNVIEEKFKKYSVEPSHDWWTHLKEGYYKFVDQNIQDNAKHTPWSCHLTPPGSQSKRK